MALYLGENLVSGRTSPDNLTISVNTNRRLQSEGAIDAHTGEATRWWTGTLEEYQAAIAAGQIQSTYNCYITDYQTPDVIDVARRAKANIPYVLLEAKWFEQNPQNPSWMVADGNYKDGTVYTDVYDALATELDDSVEIGEANANGYVKRGLSVKLSTSSSITDYDFVLNQTNHTFKLPTKANIPSAKTGDPIIGSDLVLCFYVGDVISDLQIINGGAVLSSLDRKINTNLDNLPEASKSIIAGYPMPSSRYIDLTLGASGTTYTAPANGWVYFTAGTNHSNQYIELINTNSGLQDRMLSTGSWGLHTYIPVKKNDVYQINYTAGGTKLIRFIYAQGSYND